MPQADLHQEEDQPAAAHMRPPSLRASVLGFCAVAVLCLTAAYVAFDTQKREIEINAKRNLANVALLKAGQIDHWRRERLADGMAFGNRVAFAGVFGRWLARGAPADADRRWMQDRIETIRASHEDYGALIAFDGSGNAMVATRRAGRVEEQERRLALAAMASGRTLLGDIEADVEGKPVLGMAAPLLAADDKPAGALYFRIDPARVLYPTIEAWPADSRTAETLLVRRDGDDAVFLNRLRHRVIKPLSQRLPLATADLPAAQVLLGQSGIGTGRDYRGEPVMRYLLPIADSSWGLVAKIDESEVYAPIRALAAYVVIGVLAALAFAAHVFWTLRSRAELAYRGYGTELRNRVLMQRLEQVSQSASDIIVLTDGEGAVVEANARALDAFGYTAEEMRAMNIKDLRAPECGERCDADRQRLLAVGSARFEAVYCRKDGSRFSADVSGHVVRADQRSYIQSIIRDITEQKRQETALQLHEQMTRTMQEGLVLTRARDGIIVFVNPRLETMFGYDAGEMLGRHVSVLNAPGEESPEDTAARIMRALADYGMWSGEVENVRKDGTTFWCKATVSGLDHPDHGRVWLSIHTDVTALKELERAHAEQVVRIHALGQHLVGVQETARRTLGAELHDRTSANLAAARLVMRDMLALLPPAAEGGPLTQKMEDLQALIADTTVTIRDIAGDLRPPLLDFLGLSATLKNLAAKFAHRSGIRARVLCDQVPRLDGDVETLIYRITQEALANCGKHARASHVDVALTVGAERVVLTVVDDGVGFDPASTRSGLGLITMRERAEFADGFLVIDSAPGRGTTVRVDMPRAGPAARQPAGLAAGISCA
ncbi:MAG: PAS domain S-box protein [Ignavibacteria bacterium]